MRLNTGWDNGGVTRGEPGHPSTGHWRTGAWVCRPQTGAGDQRTKVYNVLVYGGLSVMARWSEMLGSATGSPASWRLVHVAVAPLAQALKWLSVLSP